MIKVVKSLVFIVFFCEKKETFLNLSLSKTIFFFKKKIIIFDLSYFIH